ncbi:MAG: peptide ABC transporter substrate-binding protein [Candidatus Nomurabacteria bacterium]|nr:peptide ABC transporter substrate-binding protein [Candidatus Nomurabacteria bacterium]
MGNIFNRIRNFKLPTKHEIRVAISSFQKKEKLIFLGLCAVLIISTISILENINKMFMVEVPMSGGSFSEGIVGTPRFVNPILALSDADRDMTSLIYSGLMRKSPDGSIIPDLAEKYEMSPDGMSYTFTLKDKISFQDGTPVTADDIIFTINKIEDPLVKSPHKNNWDGITAEKIDEKTIKFNLKQPYTSFLENATLGILPAHIWKNSPIELNTANVNPIGSGPYQVKKVSKQASGIIDYYDLTQFKKFILGRPFINDITVKFYPNEDELVFALKNGDVDQISSITPENAETLKETNYRVESSILPRVFGLFFNQNQNQIFTDKNIVSAINQAIDKDKIITEVLHGYGVAIDDPIPPNLIAYQKLNDDVKSSHEDGLKKAQAILAKDGWTKGPDGLLQKTTVDKKKKKVTKSNTSLQFTISTGNAPELAKAAELIATDLTQLGMKVDVKTFEIGNLNQTVIRPRKYDALLFGEIITHESDLFAFWHSSQRKDPGLNVAMYTNAKVDKILEDALVTVDEKSRIKKYSQFEDEIRKDMPAVFLYSPSFVYVVSKKLDGLAIDHITNPGDRFLNVYKWSIDKDYIWKIFSK